MSDADSLSLDFLDVLPYRPRPKPLESFTSYVTRVAEGNGIATVTSFGEELFPDMLRRSLNNIGDTLAPDLNRLRSKVARTEEELQATTCYHLLRKFGRSAHPVTAGYFLSGAVSEGIRFCPLCLSADRADSFEHFEHVQGAGQHNPKPLLPGEREYYRLPWRFLMLEGCPQHEVELLDRCGHCGATIPLLSPNLKMAVCPACSGDLAACPVAPLNAIGGGTDRDKINVATVRQRWDDLRFLLTPQAWEQDDAVQAGYNIGLCYRSWRKKLQVSATDVAMAIFNKAVPERIQFIEVGSGGKSIHTGYFTTYVAYADYLGASLQEMFATKRPAT